MGYPAALGSIATLKRRHRLFREDRTVPKRVRGSIRQSSPRYRGWHRFRESANLRKLVEPQTRFICSLASPNGVTTP